MLLRSKILGFCVNAVGFTISVNHDRQFFVDLFRTISKSKGDFAVDQLSAAKLPHNYARSGLVGFGRTEFGLYMIACLFKRGYIIFDKVVQIGTDNGKYDICSIH